ncbi:hypothetical protein VTN96DRAFT_8991 [Rasamsonia emersonii]|uniref:RING finger protein (Zin) n=1 Tax=Rasamsonia emersonii (strain ATCC 16479 / CBS 393.64 / IMI 116815) TaxID=1408163 RepID=A0A0F4YWT1_RASE3|nr:RING finger protein (Zin) [Rasamsonia emersonii CBS 393.64]KKA22093.1 RING finger protein (Zin) [Rasamsonia emersonii CBS 393.64]
MVFPLPVPSFAAPLRNSSSSSSSSDVHAISEKKGGGGALPKNTAVTSAVTSTSTTLAEALRNNPFGNTSRSRALEALALVRQEDEQQRELQELNSALVTLAQLFPDVQIEVFRELLTRFDGKSRLQVCVEQLLRHKKEWVRGRWNVPVEQTEGNEGREAARIAGDDVSLVPPEEQFRSEEYKAAVKAALSKEFSALSRSTVDAVLAEANFSYTRARPTLQELSRKSWRATFNNLFPSFKRRKDKDDHPMLSWNRTADGDLVPRLKETGCKELDQELYDTLVAPILRQKREAQESRDLQLAEELNESEAKAVGALYECECCLADVTFEQIATCSASAHIICYSCIRRTLHEALFGQGWDKSIDPGKSTLKCLAPLTHGSCEGSLDPERVKSAILSDKAGFETFRKFEDRLASEALLKSQLKLVRCPFCSYAEVDPVYHPPAGGIAWRFRLRQRKNNLWVTILMTIFLLDLIPLLIIPVIVLYIFCPPAPAAIFRTSLRNLGLRTRSRRFSCRNPSCGRASCITCHKAWRDPHVCDEPLLQSLRTTVEAARTAAIKRTCPRCGLSFVKSSGCNKLTCVCGYSMCYLCRKALGRPVRAEPRYYNYEGDEEEEEEEEEGEGYKHFCEHFRINPGTRCTECNKCDLYLAEDEEAVAQRAGEKAEREWLRRQGLAKSDVAVSSGNNTGDGKGSDEASAWEWDSQLTTSLSSLQGKQPWRRRWRYWLVDVWREGQWRCEVQAAVDWVVERVIEVSV